MKLKMKMIKLAVDPALVALFNSLGFALHGEL
jgi:hypothetical protein